MWAPSGENLQSKYGGTEADEVDSGTGKYLLQTETVGSCASCGGGGGSVTRQYYYMQLDHGTPDPNEVVWLVVEDTIDANNQGVDRHVYGLSDAAHRLREVTITDPVGSPTFSCQSWKLETDTSTKLHRLNETRQPFDHNVTSSTVDEFLNPSHNGSFTNDTSTLKSSSGADRVFEYNASGDPTGELVKQGSSGTAYYVAATDYLGGTNENRKHLVTARYVYPQAETSRTAASRIATTFDHTFWTDSDTVQTAHHHVAGRGQRRKWFRFVHHAGGILRRAGPLALAEGRRGLRRLLRLPPGARPPGLRRAGRGSQLTARVGG